MSHKASEIFCTLNTIIFSVIDLAGHLAVITSAAAAATAATAAVAIT